MAVDAVIDEWLQKLRGEAAPRQASAQRFLSQYRPGDVLDMPIPGMLDKVHPSVVMNVGDSATGPRMLSMPMSTKPDAFDAVTGRQLPKISGDQAIMPGWEERFRRTGKHSHARPNLIESLTPADLDARGATGRYPFPAPRGLPKGYSKTKSADAAWKNFDKFLQKYPDEAADMLTRSGIASFPPDHFGIDPLTGALRGGFDMIRKNPLGAGLGGIYSLTDPGFQDILQSGSPQEAAIKFGGDVIGGAMAQAAGKGLVNIAASQAPQTTAAVLAKAAPVMQLAGKAAGPVALVAGLPSSSRIEKSPEEIAANQALIAERSALAEAARAQGGKWGLPEFGLSEFFFGR